ncbi:MAG: zinc ribbon domain-containing protein [Myxococcales bacterium]|nr:zinc ribbon domain-containing protein [Myxococcales bacterium]
MKDYLIVCPLCQNEIPFDSTQCTFCGALLSPGPTRSTPILKGINCPNCGTKNYSYDRCDACGQLFTKTCASCGKTVALKEQICPECGMSTRKNAAIRRVIAKKKEAGEAPTEARSPKAAYIAPIIVALLIAVVAIFYAAIGRFTGEAKVEKIKPGEAKPIDANGDGKTDLWDIYGADGKVVERRFDENHDKVMEKIVLLDVNGRPRLARLDTNADGRVDQVQIFGRNDAVRIAYHYANPNPNLVSKIEFFNVKGQLSESWSDRTGDGLFDAYERYDATGRLLMEGSDTKQNGYLDLYLVYRGSRQIFQRRYDSDGDGVIEKIESLNGEGIRVSLEEDTNGDGLFDKETLFNLDGTTRWIQLDSNADGIYDSFQSFTAEGKFARSGTDTDGDGKPDEWQ